MVIKVVSDAVAHNMFEKFTTYTSKGDRAIILCTISISLLKDRCNLWVTCKWQEKN